MFWDGKPLQVSKITADVWRAFVIWTVFWYTSNPKDSILNFYSMYVIITMTQKAL